MIIKSYNTKIQKNYNHFFQVQAVYLIDEKGVYWFEKVEKPISDGLKAQDYCSMFMMV